LRGAHLVNWCQDLFPETASALGLSWAAGPIGRVLKSIRNLSLRHARTNVVLHEKMADRLRSEGVSPEQIKIIPNWADAAIRPVAQSDNSLRRDWGLSGHIVIGYSGNLGRAHMPEKISELVHKSLDIEGIRWLFVGGGAGLGTLKAQFAGDPRVLFKPYQPRGSLSLSLSAADLHLVSLDPGCEGLIYPSKYYGIRAAGRPVLFLGAGDGAIAQDISSEASGFVLEAGAPETWHHILKAAVEDVSKAPEISSGGSQARLQLARWKDVLVA
jgi:hypothetical protein